MTAKTPMEMFAELVKMGKVISSTVEPSNLMAPTGYISVPTTLVFATPPKLPVLGAAQKVTANAKLAARSQRNTKRNKRRK